MISNIQSKRTESDYLKSLPETEKTSYKAKLTLSDGFALPDPFAIEEWSDNTSKNSGSNLSRHLFTFNRYS